MSRLIIRKATLQDASALVDIYAPYVEKTAITFEYEVPSVEEFQQRMANIMVKYPYLVAEYDHEIVGYAYTSAYYGRAAYQWCAEYSIYIKQDQRHLGLGKQLLNKIETISRKQGIIYLYACIATTEVDDEHLTNNSVSFHEHMGFHQIAHFNQCGYKFHKWYSMVWMEKKLGETSTEVQPIIAFPLLKEEDDNV